MLINNGPPFFLKHPASENMVLLRKKSKSPLTKCFSFDWLPRFCTKNHAPTPTAINASATIAMIIGTLLFFFLPLSITISSVTCSAPTFIASFSFCACCPVSVLAKIEAIFARLASFVTSAFCASFSASTVNSGVLKIPCCSFCLLSVEESEALSINLFYHNHF